MSGDHETELVVRPLRTRLALGLALATASALAALALGEGAVRLAGYPPMIRYVLQSYANNDRYGWVMQPLVHGRKIGDPEGDYVISTDSEGFRVAENEARADSEPSNIVAVGDSYTFGLEVPYAEGYFAQLERILRQKGRPQDRVRTVGIPGWSPFQYRNRVKDLLKSPSAGQIRWIVIGLTLGNDLGPSPTDAQFARGKPYVENGFLVGSWTTSESKPAPPRENPFRAALSAFKMKTAIGSLVYRLASRPSMRPFFERIGFAHGPEAELNMFTDTAAVRKAWNSTLPTLVDINRLCAERNISVVVLPITSPAQFLLKPDDRFFINRIIADDLRKHGVLYADPTPQLSLADYKRGSAHWNTGGHLKAAASLGDAILSKPGR